MPKPLATALLAALLLAGCADPPPGERLGPLGEELLPPGSEIVKSKEGACPQLEGNPSCVRIYFTSGLAEEERADALEASARAAGWEVVSREQRVDGTLVELGREGYRGFAAIWEDEHAAPCREEPDTSCADELQVIEDV